MFIEIEAPCILPLGLATTEEAGQRRMGLMGVTLEYPPTQLFVYAHPTLHVTGARAHVAREYAQRFLSSHDVGPAAIEIELATYSHMGLGSDGMLGLSTARGLAWAHELPMDDTPALAWPLDLKPHQALEVWGFDRGGLLLVEHPSEGEGMPGLVRRHAIQAEDKADDWVFVCFFPKVPAGAPEDLERQRLGALLEAAPFLDQEALGQHSDGLWSALAGADFEGFAASLMRVQDLNREALAHSGTPERWSDKERDVLALMQQHGARAWGRSFAGLGLYGLIRGAKPSVELRRRLRPQIDVHEGILMATIPDNEGARHTIREGKVADYMLPGG